MNILFNALSNDNPRVSRAEIGDLSRSVGVEEAFIGVAQGALDGNDVFALRQ